MKKFFVVSLIIFLIFSTAIIKNSTKRIDDEIFTVNENLRSLKIEYENTKLENDYLSSAEKLFEFQNLYFDNELIQKDIKKINIVNEDFIEIEKNLFDLINDR